MNQRDSNQPDDANDENLIDPGFVQATLADISAWVRFADAKAGAVLVLLGLLLADALSNAGTSYVAYKIGSYLGWAVTVLFWGAMLAVAVAVALTSLALFPRVRASTTSMSFYRDIRDLGDYRKYRQRLQDIDSVDEQAKQVWELSAIAVTKFQLLRWAYIAALLFLTMYVAGRLSFTLA